MLSWSSLLCFLVLRPVPRRQWQIAAATACLLGAAGQSFAVVTKSRLDSVKVLVNGNLQIVTRGADLVVLEGDRLRIEEALLTSKQQPEIVNLVGFKKSEIGNPYDDRKKIIAIPEDLSSRWAIGSERNRYRVVVRSKSWMHGRIYLRVEQPQIHSFVASLNGQDQTIKAGEVIAASATDILHIKAVNSNFDTADKNFRYEIVKDGINARLVFTRFGVDVASFSLIAKE